MWPSFCRYTILWERSAERNRKRKRGAFQMTGRKSGALQMTRRKSPNFRITGRIPQAGCFFACLCTTNTEYLPLGGYCLQCFCCPLHVESRVKEIIRSTEGAILYGGGESSEPLCPDDVIHISLLKGLGADGHTTDDETQLRWEYRLITLRTKKLSLIRDTNKVSQFYPKQNPYVWNKPNQCGCHCRFIPKFGIRFFGF